MKIKNGLPLMSTAAKEFQDKIAVGIDARNGKVAANGWLDTSNIDYIELAKRMEDIGIKYIIFTDISKHGSIICMHSSALKHIFVDDRISMQQPTGMPFAA